ncbi:MAG TPA: hypothetical protein EYQ50_10240 [Verrucomicrobiales bacterium]|nr:hypothetical protein [Verrucomicrobiales bacterium]
MASTADQTREILLKLRRELVLSRRQVAAILELPQVALAKLTKWRKAQWVPGSAVRKLVGLIAMMANTHTARKLSNLQLKETNIIKLSFDLAIGVIAQPVQQAGRRQW